LSLRLLLRLSRRVLTFSVRRILSTAFQQVSASRDSSTWARLISKVCGLDGSQGNDRDCRLRRRPEGQHQDRGNGEGDLEGVAESRA
jgi:hypothetical protein